MITFRSSSRNFWNEVCTRRSSVPGIFPVKSGISQRVRGYNKSAGENGTDLNVKALHDWNHSDLFEEGPHHVNRQDNFDIQTRNLFFNAIAPFLPPDLASDKDDRLNLGHHMFYFPTRNDTKDLLPDGTDAHFLPGPANIWKFRLWAGGSLKLNTSSPPAYENNRQYEMIEEVTNMRVVGRHIPEKVFVTITKYVGLSQRNSSEKSESVEQIASRLRGYSIPSDACAPTNGSTFVESQNLCFLREPPKFEPQKFIRPPLDAQFLHTMIPTRWLLFTWSALTQNAHLIHIDKDYAQKEYGVRNLLVHGPMTIVLMLEFLRRVLTNSDDSLRAKPIIRSVQYRNIAPLYVDEELTFCCKLVSSHIADDSIRKWEVWIQAGQGSALHLAVRATVEVTE